MVTTGSEGTYDLPEPGAARVDLHLHSTCSDGLSRPAEVVDAAQESGLLAIALTDHDTVAGIAEARQRAERLDLAFVPGIEFSCHDETGSTHLLGYFIDPQNGGLLECLGAIQADRLNRAEAIVAKLNGLGLEVTFEAVLAQAAPSRLIARPHIARALVEGGWVKSYGEAFARFLAAGQPAYVPTLRISPAEGIARIQAAGGLAVLAHPGLTHGEQAIRRLAAAGLDGLETLHPEHGPCEVRKLRRLAAELDLLETGGSDWHGRSDRRRGQLASQAVPYEWYLKLSQAAERRRLGIRG
ncbi:MAG: PHP domain-containing protein [Gemmatimonadota bacterium]|nr:MAG: PHP domain-containing protein [Gemmatimonadota bacterium]